MLREARIVMPFRQADDMVEHRQLRASLLAAFGGYTCTFGKGAWRDGIKDYIDEVVIYDVAIEADRDASWDKLFQIAMTAGRELKQEAVYIRYPDGRVDIASCAVKPADNDPEATRNGATLAEQDALPLGAKRLPQVGEVWRNAINQLVAVISTVATIDGGLVCQPLTKGDHGSTRAWVDDYFTDLDGFILRDHSSHPRNLKTYVTRFDS